MMRQVLPARRRYLTTTTIALSAVLAGCALGAVIPVPLTPSPGVAPSVWTLDLDADCDASWLMPAVYCLHGEPVLYNNCHWRCEMQQ